MKKTICVVDDDHSVRKALVNLLRSEGYLALGFESGEEFLQSSGGVSDVHCVLLDMCMPGLRGLDVQLALSHTPNPPSVLCMSAYWNELTLKRAKSLGAIECLDKPFSSETLMRAINMVV